MNIAFQFLDVALVAFVLISAIHATYRGFVSESLSIFAWLAAAFATLYFGPWTAVWMREMVSPAWLGEVVGYALIFIIVVLPLSFASSRFAESVKKSQVGTLDAALGAAFGIVRGLGAIGIAYLVYSMAVSPVDQPNWVTKSRLMPVVRASSEVVASLIPDQKVTPRHHAVARHDETPAAKPKTAKAAPVSIPKPVKKAASKRSKKAYGAKERQALEKLIETSDGGKSGKP